jgi:hypothetical protein
MSGPITAGFYLTYALLGLCARAAQEARAMRQEYADVLARLSSREAALAQNREQHRAARVERLRALHRQAELERTRVERMHALATSLGLPAPAIVPLPSNADDTGWRGYIDALKSIAGELEALLANAGAKYAEQIRIGRESSARAPTLDEVLSAYARSRESAPGLDDAQAARFKATAARVLARLELPDGKPLPSELEALAREIVLAPSVERAEALATELRLAVQRARDAREAQSRNGEEARKLLAALGESAPQPLVEALERVVAGIDALDAPLRQAANDLLDATAGATERQAQEAASIVLEQSLRDLGYEVDDISATLFVDGGTVNFRRAGWENYYVRLRVAADERTVNFNVVRARGDEEGEERRRLDTLAEDRWCTEFPELMRTLESRGLTLDVTRRLAAGELPVQVVDPATVPARREDERDTRAPPLRAKPAP